MKNTEGFSQEYIIGAFYELQRALNERDLDGAEAAAVILGAAMSQFSEYQNEEYWLAVMRLDTLLGGTGEL